MDDRPKWAACRSTWQCSPIRCSIFVVDVRGPQFTTYIQGQQVDTWTDDQLKVGGVGFLNERDERGKVKSVSIRYLSGAAK